MAAWWPGQGLMQTWDPKNVDVPETTGPPRLRCARVPWPAGCIRALRGTPSPRKSPPCRNRSNSRSDISSSRATRGPRPMPPVLQTWQDNGGRRPIISIRDRIVEIGPDHDASEIPGRVGLAAVHFDAAVGLADRERRGRRPAHHQRGDGPRRGCSRSSTSWIHWPMYFCRGGPVRQLDGVLVRGQSTASTSSTLTGTSRCAKLVSQYDSPMRHRSSKTYNTTTCRGGGQTRRASRTRRWGSSSPSSRDRLRLRGGRGTARRRVPRFTSVVPLGNSIWSPLPLAAKPQTGQQRKKDHEHQGQRRGASRPTGSVSGPGLTVCSSRRRRSP